jgi:SAM-dependent methyltransferase
VAEPDSYDLTAAYYSARTPYLPNFFPCAAEVLGLSKQTFVLDLACGSGELAAGFAPYCRSILAVDKSPTMLSARRAHPENVRFLEADLDAGIGPFPDLVDLVTIGRAIHHLRKDSIIPLLRSATTESASVLVCGAQIAPKTPWLPEYLELQRRYRSYEQTKDYMGQDFFAETEWRRAELILVTETMRYGLHYLLRLALSYSRGTKAILSDLENFRRELDRVLKPYYDDSHQVSGEIVTWGIPYRRCQPA